MSPTHSREARQPGDFPADAITVNLVRLAGLTKDKARECEAIVRQVLAALSSSNLTGGEQAEFELHCGDEFAAGASGPRDRAWAEIQHYAAQYQQDGPLMAYEVTRKPVDLTLARSFAGEDRDYCLQRAVDERGEKR